MELQPHDGGAAPRLPGHGPSHHPLDDALRLRARLPVEARPERGRPPGHGGRRRRQKRQQQQQEEGGHGGVVKEWRRGGAPGRLPLFPVLWKEDGICCWCWVRRWSFSPWGHAGCDVPRGNHYKAKRPPGIGCPETQSHFLFQETMEEIIKTKILGYVASSQSN